jgi:hypothetical protein
MHDFTEVRLVKVELDALVLKRTLHFSLMTIGSICIGSDAFACLYRDEDAGRTWVRVASIGEDSQDSQNSDIIIELAPPLPVRPASSFDMVFSTPD